MRHRNNIPIMGGRTYREVAEGACMNERHLYQIVNGKYPPSMEIAIRLAAYFGMTVDRLYEELEVMQRQWASKQFKDGEQAMCPGCEGHSIPLIFTIKVAGGFTLRDGAGTYHPRRGCEKR